MLFPIPTIDTNSSVLSRCSVPFPPSTIDHLPSTVDHRSSTIDHRPSVIATSFPILWLSHRIRCLLLQTTDLPNTIDLLHQTIDDGIASTIPTIASDISFRSASILPQTRNGAPFAVGLIQPSTAPFAMGWVGCILVGNTTDPAHRDRPKGIFLFWIFVYIFFFWIRTLSLFGLYNYIYKPFTMGFSFFFFHGCSISRFIAIVFLFILFLHSNQS